MVPKNIPPFTSSDAVLKHIKTELRINPLAVSPEQAVQIFPCLNVGTMANDRSKRRGCKFYRIGRKVVYRLADLEAFVFQTPVQTINHQFDE